MPFIGTQPEVGGYSVLDALTASATASYTLQLNSANFVPASANQLLVSLNGVIQKPGSSFTVSGSTLTFSSALDSSDSIDFIISMGEPLLIGTPSDNTITTNKLVNDSVTGAKIENNPTIAGNLTVSGNTSASGTLTSTGLITASAGVAIGGTGAANTLDDYEEGTFTLGILNGWGVLNPTYSYNTGYYTKVGDLVYVRAQLVLSGGSFNANMLKVTGFPFAPMAGTDSALFGYFVTAASTAENSFLQAVASSTIFDMRYKTGTGIAGFSGNHGGTGMNFIFSGVYKTA